MEKVPFHETLKARLQARRDKLDSDKKLAEAAINKVKKARAKLKVKSKKQ